MSKASKWYARCIPGEKFPDAWQPLGGARRVNIPGWEDFDFCVHRMFGAGGQLLTDCWRVTEGRSGYAVNGDFEETRKEAVEVATSLLERVGKERFQERRDKQIAATGLSPRYAVERSES